MGRRLGLMVCAVFALTVGGAGASAEDGNSVNAKLCRKGGWQSAFTQSGVAFASEAQCSAYAAGGGTVASIVVSTDVVRCPVAHPTGQVRCWGVITGHGLEPTDPSSLTPSL